MTQLHLLINEMIDYILKETILYAMLHKMWPVTKPIMKVF